jgi:hypothetical protein
MPLARILRVQKDVAPLHNLSGCVAAGLVR